jgi:hypothetical protein
MVCHYKSNSNRQQWITADISEARIASIITMVEVVRTSETSVYFYETTHRYIPEGRNLHNCCQQDLKYHIFQSLPLVPAPRAKRSKVTFLERNKQTEKLILFNYSDNDCVFQIDGKSKKYSIICLYLFLLLLQAHKY